MTAIKNAIGAIKLNNKVYCTICNGSIKRDVSVLIYSNDVAEIEAAKVEAKTKFSKPYTCRICKSILKSI